MIDSLQRRLLLARSRTASFDEPWVSNLTCFIQTSVASNFCSLNAPYESQVHNTKLKNSLACQIKNFRGRNRKASLKTELPVAVCSIFLATTSLGALLSAHLGRHP